MNMAETTERLALITAALADASEHGSVTVGLAQLQPGDSPEDLVARADAALYRERQARPDPTPESSGRCLSGRRRRGRDHARRRHVDHPQDRRPWGRVDDGSSCRYCLADWVQSGQSAAYTFLYRV